MHLTEWESEQVLVNTVEPRYKDPRYNDIPGIKINMLCPVKSYSKMSGTEPRCNDLQYNGILDRTMSFKRTKCKIFLDITILQYISTQITWVSKYSYNRACNFKSDSGFVLVQFWNYLCEYSLNCTPLCLVTITI